jgi:hypothetical protein
VFNQVLIPAVQETLRQTRQQIQPLVRPAQQKSARSELIVPPSNRATISRLPEAPNPKLDWLHSVIAKAVLFLALTAVWKLSYATKDGLFLPIAGEKCGLIDNGITACSDCSLAPGNLGARRVWVDPNAPNVLFVSYGIALARSTDSGASWQVVGPSDNSIGLYFETPEPGVIYIFTFRQGSFRSTDDGQTFQPVTIPSLPCSPIPPSPDDCSETGPAEYFKAPTTAQRGPWR